MLDIAQFTKLLKGGLYKNYTMVGLGTGEKRKQTSEPVTRVLLIEKYQQSTAEPLTRLRFKCKSSMTYYPMRLILQHRGLVQAGRHHFHVFVAV